jgi:hypothetical protein
MRRRCRPPSDTRCRAEVGAKEQFAVLKTVKAAHERTKDTGLSYAAAVIESVLEEKL